MGGAYHRKEDLVSLQEFNRVAMLSYREEVRDRPNGIACPTCGKELVDGNPALVTLGSPPTTQVRCKFCWFTGSRVVV